MPPGGASDALGPIPAPGRGEVDHCGTSAFPSPVEPRPRADPTLDAPGVAVERRPSVVLAAACQRGGIGVPRGRVPPWLFCNACNASVIGRRPHGVSLGAFAGAHGSACAGSRRVGVRRPLARSSACPGAGRHRHRLAASRRPPPAGQHPPTGLAVLLRGSNRRERLVTALAEHQTVNAL